jgi:hypothetical protein
MKPARTEWAFLLSILVDARFKAVLTLGSCVRWRHRLDDGGSTHVWNVGRHQFDCTALYPRRLWTSYSAPWEPEISHWTIQFACIGRTENVPEVVWPSLHFCTLQLFDIDSLCAWEIRDRASSCSWFVNVCGFLRRLS